MGQATARAGSEDRPTAVYRIYDEPGELLYVGMTHAPAARMHKHRVSPWGSRMARIEWEQFPSRAQASHREIELIATLRPSCNVRQHELPSGSAGCVVPETDGPCGKPVHVKSRGWCGMHYARFLTHGDLQTVRPGSGPGDPIPRFQSKVDKDGPLPLHMPELGPCWLFTGRITPKGYGAFDLPERAIPAHRFAWTAAHGPIPDGLCVLHRCDNRRCVNPAHLFLGTSTDNNRDREAKGRGKVPRLFGERHPNSKLTTEQVEAIRARYALGCILQRELAVEYGVCQHTVQSLLAGATWAGF